MKMKTVGYIVCMSPKRFPAKTEPGSWMELLSYGWSGEYPYADELLRDRGATIFKTKKDAQKEIEKILDTKKDHDFTKKFLFGIVAVGEVVS